MSPASRGNVVLSAVRRHASTAPPKTTVKHATSKSTVKSKLPPPNGSNSTRLRARDTKPETPPSTPKDEQAYKFGFLGRFFQHPQFRWQRRALLATPVLLVASLHWPYEIVTVNGASMSPFLNPNSTDGFPTTDRILIQRIHSDSFDTKERGSKEDSSTEYKRGQIVVFPTPHSPKKLAVKRIVAVPGDLVQPLPGYAGGDMSVVVPWNHVWVEGDVGRREESMDSNWYGPISQNLIIGEVKAVLTSWVNWNWLDWKQHTWPARVKERVDENAIMEAAVDPDAVHYSSGWRDGSIALILERMRSKPEKMLYSFVNDAKTRQETRRLYNNALYVADIAASEQEKQLASEVCREMEDIYGREALIFGIRMKRQVRDRGELPNAGNSKMGERRIQDLAASDAEKWLKRQGWELERHQDGTVRTTHSPLSPSPPPSR